MSGSRLENDGWAGSVARAADRATLGFEQIAATTRLAWRVAPGWETRVRPALSRLLMLGQARDAFEQRLDNLRAMLGAAEGRGALGRRPFHAIVAAHLDALASLLERTADEAGTGLGELAGTEATSPGSSGDPTAELGAAADLLRAEAETHRRWPCAGPVDCDIDWMKALYKCDDEHRVHRSAVARCLAEPS